MLSNKILQFRTTLPSILYRYKSRIANPGIQNRLKFMQDYNTHDFEDDNFDYELNVDESKNLYSDHKYELKQQREKLKLLITRQKYFNDKYPSFLTWQEKENIIYLHNLNPEENTPEKLSQSFPALPETIRKIIKTKWRPQSSSRIEIYNEKVKRNWNDFFTNKLHLSEELSNHLNKFSTHKNIENIPKICKTDISERIYQKTPVTLGKTEFQNILKIGNTKEEIEKPNDCKELIDCNTIQNSSQVPNKPITLEKFKKFVRIEKKINETNEKTNENNGTSKFSKLTTSINSSNKKEVDYISERIEIPKKYLIKGKIYKVSDCFYDDDGEFLYRVPGMK